jgi:hypothetical protein
MKIAEQNIAAIEAFGYTESEARFLYIVATHSGYFIPRQFIAFTGAKWGKRSTHFAEKIESRGHAAWRKYPGIGGVYHLFAKRLYGEIGKENSRNRRRHSVEFIHTRLVLLDFVLANQQHEYLETEPEKLRYFCEQLEIPRKHLPAKAYVGSSRTEPTLRYFVDKYPLFLDLSSSLPSPVVTLSYVDPGQASIAGFKHHLQAYDALFRTLGDFHFLYISNTRAHFARATEWFSSRIQQPLQADVSVEILRYFRLRQAWEMEQYGTLDSDDIEWLQDAMKRFRGGKYDACYSAWASGRVGELELRKEFVPAERQQTVEFHTYFIGGWGGCR